MRRVPVIFIIFAFLLNTLGFMPALANEISLPKPGVMVPLSPSFNPPVLKGIKVYPDNPFRFEFILDQGDKSSFEAERESISAKKNFLNSESTKLIKYFLASLTTPEEDMWVTY